MAIQNTMRTWSIKAEEALDTTTAGTGHLYKAVSNRDGVLANNGLNAVGILQQGGPSGSHISLGFDGIMKAVASIAISSKDMLLTVTTSGYVKPVTDGDYVVGRALNIASSGDVFEGLFSFIAPFIYETTNPAEEFTAQADLSSGLNKFVDMGNGDFAAASNNAAGVLITGTTSGGTSEAIVDGRVDIKAGGVLTAGQSIKCASGWAVAGNSGDLLVGRALAASAAGNSGSTVACVVGLATPTYATSCLDVQY